LSQLLDRLRTRIRMSRTRLRFLRTTLMLRASRQRLRVGADALLVVSLTTFPARVRDVWATIVTLLNQTHPPDALVLVLSQEEFPDRRIPRGLRRIQKRGLTILWTEKNLRAHNKLLPVRKEFPRSTIVTVDDDILYEPTMLASLVREAKSRPDTIIGHRGWCVQWDEGGLRPYFEWMPAGRAGPTTEPDRVFLTGVGGVLYPPGHPPAELLLDESAAVRVTPTADDVWFWAASVAGGSARFCTGARYGRPNGLEGLSPALLDVNRAANDLQLRAAVDHFNLTEWLAGRMEG